MASEIKIGRERMSAVEQKELNREVLTWEHLRSDDGELPSHEMGGDATGLVENVDPLDDVFGCSGYHYVQYEDVPTVNNSLGISGIDGETKLNIGCVMPGLVENEQLVEREGAEVGSKVGECLKTGGASNGAVVRDSELFLDDDDLLEIGDPKIDATPVPQSNTDRVRVLRRNKGFREDV